MATPVREGFRLSPQQTRLWQLQQASKGACYKAHSLILIEGNLDSRALEKAFNAVINRQEILRTRFAYLPGLALPIQVISDSGSVVIKKYFLRASDSEEQRRRVERLYLDSLYRDNDYDGPSILDVSLIALSDLNHAMIVSLPALHGDDDSLVSMIRELSQEYDARGGDDANGAEQIQYADVAEVFNTLLESDESRSGREYWRKKLARGTNNFKIGLESDRAYADGFSPAVIRRAISRDRARSLEDLARRSGTSLQALLLTCWAVLIWRLSGRADITIGALYDGRTFEGLDAAIGLFARYLPVEFRPTSGLAFADALKQVELVTRDSYNRQNYFDWEASQSAIADHACPPFYSVCFDFHRRSAAYAGSGIRLSIEKLYSCIDRFNIRLSCTRTEDALSTEFYYDAALFQESDVRRLAEQYLALIESVAKDVRGDIGALEMLGEEERRLLLHEFQGRDEDYGAGIIHRRIEEQAEQTPDATALVYEGEHVSYATLNRRANQLAHYLIDKGVGPESLVGISMERSTAMAIGLLAILKAGGGYLPLDPEYPAERLEFMLQDSGAEILLTEERLRDLFPDYDREMIPVESWQEIIAGNSVANPVVQVTPENLAYVIYTSGSTGRPKGAIVTHAGVYNCISAMQEIYRLDDSDKFLFKTSLNFDSSVWEYFWPLWVGGSVVIARSRDHLDTRLLVDLIAGQQVTSIYFVPSMLGVFLKERSVADCITLRRVICGGESLTVEAMQSFFANLSADLHHSYGPTETSIAASEWTCASGWERPLAPIGMPLTNTQILLLDPQGGLAPIKVAGELSIAGRGLGRGYLYRPDITAERFVPHPFSLEPGARLYRSGDLGRFLSDGEIEFLGRVDYQVKLRGQRIELGEIEAVLREFGAREAVVVVRGTGSDDEMLTAYITLGDDALRSASDMTAHLKQRLPDYMVPSEIIILDKMPLTPSGKVDRKALPEPKNAASLAEDEGPRSPVQEIIAGVFADVLKRERVGVDGDFFKLGGHSLLATQVVSRVRDVLGVELALRVLFESPTVAGLAEAVEAARREGQPVQPPIRAVGRAGNLPLSYAQQRLWFIDQLEPGSAAYNIPAAVRLVGRLDEQALSRSLNEIVRRHEVLRTIFPSRDGEPRQQICEHRELRLDIIELTQGDEAERDQRLQEILREEATRGFELSIGPLMRAKLIGLGEAEHVLMVNMHHIISDGWSMQVVVREFSQLYEAFSQGQDSPLDELEIQYVDFAVWQREWLQGEVLDRQLEYWKGQLEGVSVLELPTDSPRPPAASYRGANASIVFSEELTAKLKQMSRREGVTLFMSLLAGFQVLLARYSGQEDIAVGSPIAGRNRREIEGLIGFFVNTLVMRVDMGGDPSVAELLGRARETTLDAYAHQDLPFEKLVEELQPDRSLSHTPLFQVLFVMQNVPQDAHALSELNVKGELLESAWTKYEITLGVVEQQGAIHASMEYASELYDEWKTERMLEHFERLLEGMTDNEQARVMQLPMMREEERHQIIVEWNRTDADFDRKACIHHIIQHRALAIPDSVAVVFKHLRISYSQLDSVSNQAANYLRCHAVAPEVKVGLMMDRSIELVVWMLGILKAGAAYVPIDPAYPRSRREMIVEDSGLDLVVTDQQPCQLISGARLILTQEVREDVRQQSTELGDSGVMSSNLAYVIYTSGSTGRPKGVGLEHRGVISLMKWAERAYSREEMAGVLATTSICFDLSVYEILVVLGLGGKVILGKSGVEAREEMGSGEVVQVNTVPSLMEGVLREGELNASIKVVNLAGEALRRELVEEVYDRSRVERVVNLYGPSEDTTYTTMEEEERGSGERVGIGRGIENTRIYIVDGAGEIVVVGARGEIYIGSESLARGYEGKAEATAERFVPDGWSGERGRRVYRTGDVGRYNRDGRIEYVGRIDNQVKVRGYRIELGEIEAVLGEHGSIEQAVVVAREDEPGDKRLVGYVVAKQEVRQSELKEYLRARLPEYMVPGVIVELSEMPLTANGKLDRRGLPKVEVERAGSEYVAARSAVEEIVSGIFCEVLKVERVGVEENFFELGGHSLLATQVVSRVRKQLGVEVALRSLFTNPTVAAIAKEVEQQQRGEQAVGDVITRVSRGGELPLSYAQQRLWFIDQLEPGSAAYNIPAAVRLVGRLDEQALSRSLAEIVRRHEVLRTIFPSKDGEPRQQIQESRELGIEIINLKECEEAEREEELEEILREEARRGFELSIGPLMRAKLIRLGEAEHVLMVNMHHIVSDGWSIEIVVREFAQLYEAYTQGLQSPLPDLDIQYADYALWQRGWLQGDLLDHQLQYWRRQLQGLTILELPTDRARSAAASYRGASERIVLSEELTAKLKQMSRREGVTMFMSLLAGFQVLLARYSGQEDIAVGTPIAGRNRQETESLIGLFLNTLVMRVNVEGNPSVAELLGRVRETALGAYAHQDLPFEKLVEEIRPERSLSHQPLFQVWFVLHNIPVERIDLPGLRVESIGGDDSFTKFDLMLSVSEGEKEMTATMRYSTELFDGRRIKRMLSHYEYILEGMTADDES